jgi:hypothetical protein
MNKFSMLAIVGMVCGPVVASAAAAGADTVLSVSIKKADGATGQNTATGSGVKTAHIQDGAITTAKIAAGAVADAQIAGPISASKISSTGLNADTVDGKHASAFRQKVPTAIVVSPEGNADFTDPVAALQSIIDASASKPYLVKILPGVYTVTSSIIAKPFVDIEGSGQGVTKVVRNGGSEVLQLASDAEVRDLTLTGQGTAVVARTVAGAGNVKLSRVTIVGAAATGSEIDGIYHQVTAPLTLDRVTIQTTGASNFSFALHLAPANLVVRDSQITAAGGWAAYAIYVDGSSYGNQVDISNSRLEAYSGAQNRGLFLVPGAGARGELWIRNSTVVASNDSADSVGLMLNSVDLFLDGSALSAAYLAVNAGVGTVVRAAHSQLDGGLQKDGTSTFTCVGAYSAAYTPVACP